MGNTTTTDRRDLISILRDVVFIAALYLYFCGWVYIYLVYRHFGISFNALDVPFYYFFVYSYSVLAGVFSYSVVAVVFSVVSIIVLLALVYFFFSDYLKVWVLALCLISLFPGLFFLARREANKEILEIRRGRTKSITFVVKRNVAENLPKEFVEANKNAGLKLLAQTKDRVFVLRQPLPSGDTDQIPYGFVYDVSRADILVATISIPNVSNELVK